MLKLSIIIPYYNKHDDIFNLLTSIDNSLKVNFNDIEILIVTNEEINIPFHQYFNINDSIKILIPDETLNTTYEQYGIQNAVGEFVTIADAHDMFASCLSLSAIEHVILSNPGYNYYTFGIIDENQNQLTNLLSSQNSRIYGNFYNKEFLMTKGIQFIALGSFSNAYINRLLEVNGAYQYQAQEIVYFISNNNSEKVSVLSKSQDTILFETFYGIRTMFNKIKELSNGNLTFYIPEIVKVIYDLTYSIYNLEHTEQPNSELIYRLKKILKSLINNCDPQLLCLSWNNPSYVNSNSQAYLKEIIEEGGNNNV